MLEQQKADKKAISEKQVANNDAINTVIANQQKLADDAQSLTTKQAELKAAELNLAAEKATAEDEKASLLEKKAAAEAEAKAAAEAEAAYKAKQASQQQKVVASGNTTFTAEVQAVSTTSSSSSSSESSSSSASAESTSYTPAPVKQDVYKRQELVTSAQFTEDSILREQDIIQQEREMYQDDPDSCLFFSTLANLYPGTPLATDIVGSEESISQINLTNLQENFTRFYKPCLLYTSLGRTGRYLSRK